MNVVLGVAAFCLFCGGIIPLLWFLVPGANSGAQCDEDAKLYGLANATRNKRVAPQVCATELTNTDLGIT